MSLECSPDIENVVRERAATEGITVNDLLTRTFAPVVQETPPDPPPITDPKAHVLALIAKRQAEDNTPQYPPVPTRPGETEVGALFRKWAEEDSKLTEEEKKAAEQNWEEYKQAFNETRIASGMRPLF